MQIDLFALCPFRSQPTSNALLPVTGQARLILEQLLSSFDRRSNLHHGSFTDTTHPVAQAVQLLLSQPINEENGLTLLQTLSAQLTANLEEQDDEQPDYLSLLVYRDATSQYLMLAPLNLQPAIILTPEGQPRQEQSLALDQLPQALKINLSALRLEQDDYLSFIAGRNGANAPEGFMARLGCEAPVAAREATTDLIKAAADYCDKNQLGETKQEAMEQIVDYMQQQKKDREPVALGQVERMLDVYIPPEQAETAAGTFGSFARGGDYQIRDSFQPHALTLRRLGRLQAKTGSWKLELVQQALGPIGSSREVEYDAAQNRLIMNNLPPALQQQLQSATDSE